MSDNEELKQKWMEEDAAVVEMVYKELLSGPDGRKFLFHLLSITKLMNNPFTPNALSMSFACGEMNVGQRILADILRVSPDGWTLMQKEANDVYRTRQQSLE